MNGTNFIHPRLCYFQFPLKEYINKIKIKVISLFVPIPVRYVKCRFKLHAIFRLQQKHSTYIDVLHTISSSVLKTQMYSYCRNCHSLGVTLSYTYIIASLIAVLEIYI